MKDEMDILKEIGSTAAAHGSIALSEILGRKIVLHVPTVKIVPCREIEKVIQIEGVAIALQTRILSGLRGKILFVLEEKNAYRLVDICYKFDKEAKEEGSVFTEIGLSLIKEVGNVVVSTYINTLGYFLKKLIVPSLPVLINAPFAEIIKIIAIDYEDTNSIVVIESIFEETKEKIKGNFWLVLSPQAAEEITQTCKKILDEFLTEN